MIFCNFYLCFALLFLARYVTVKSGYPQYVGTWLHCGDVPPGGISAGSLFSAEEEPTGEEQEEP